MAELLIELIAGIIHPNNFPCIVFLSVSAYEKRISTAWLELETLL